MRNGKEKRHFILVSHFHNTRVANSWKLLKFVLLEWIMVMEQGLISALRVLLYR